MSDQNDIPMLTDLIEKGLEITMSDLGLNDDLDIAVDDVYAGDSVIDETDASRRAIDPFKNNPTLEFAIRNILEEHLELAFQEIKLVIQRDLDKPGS